MTIVVDSSYALACVLPDEPRPKSMKAVLGDVLAVPFIWPIEVANAMRSAVRRKRFDAERALSFAQHAAGLGVRVVSPWDDDASRYLR
ncbi:MAG: type II toxin-antitoxin system VapC family toxin, partial [Pseudomonadota bacterium]|nr:type II toxin-antitoxin system VapC family toxin [Pseudomonadota bacterium]